MRLGSMKTAKYECLQCPKWYSDDDTEPKTVTGDEALVTFTVHSVGTKHSTICVPCKCPCRALVIDSFVMEGLFYTLQNVLVL